MTSQFPDFLKNRQSKSLNETAAQVLGSSNPPHISILGGRFTLVDSTGATEQVQTLYLDVCVIDQLERKSKLYYAEAWRPDEGKPPTCWSDNGVAPSVNAAEPQSPTCSACELNVWGSEISKVSGKKVKACRDYLKLACVVPGDDLVFLLRLPPNSHKGLQGYVQRFQGTGVDLSDVVTRMKFQEGVQGTLEFAAVGYIDEPTFKMREEALAAKKTDALVGRTDVPRTAALAAPSGLANNDRRPGALVELPRDEALTNPQGAGTPAQEPEKRRRRTKAEMEAAKPAAATAPPAQAPFRPAASPVSPTPAAAPAGNGALFGMQQGAEPTTDVKSTLDSLFGQ